MPWIANVIADASYEEGLFIGGYAGGVCLLNTDDEQLQLTEMCPGVMPDAPNSNVVEMRAVTAMLHRLLRMMQSNTLTISKLNIYTDSRTLIQEYQAFQRGEGQAKYLEQLQLLDHTLSKLKIPADAVTFHKVKAHVPDADATPIERLHNLIDKNAKSARFMLQNHYFKPELSKNKRYYGALMHPSVSDEQFAELIATGFALAEKGMKARIYAGNYADTQDTPLAIGIRLYAESAGVDINSLYEPVYGHADGGLRNGCEGADRTFLRKEMTERGLYTHHVDFNRSHKINGAVATRLMLGQQYIGHFNSTHLTGRNEPASQFVVALHNAPGQYDQPEQVAHWLHKISSWNHQPLVHDLEGLRQKVACSPVPAVLVTEAHQIAQSASELLREMQEFMSGRPLILSLHEVMIAEHPGFSLDVPELSRLIETMGTSEIKFRAGVCAALLRQSVASHLKLQAQPERTLSIRTEQPLIQETVEEPVRRAAVLR